MLMLDNCSQIDDVLVHKAGNSVTVKPD